MCWPQGHRARPVSLGGLQGPPPARRGFVCAAPLWEGASRGTRWRGKGGIAGALHAQQPAPPAPRRGRAPVPGSPGVPAAPLPRTQRRLAAACARFAPISPDPGSCRKWLPKRRQSPRCPGRGARSSPAPCSPPPLGDSSEAQTLADSGAWGRDGGGRASTCRRGLTGCGGWWRETVREGHFRVPTPTNVSSVLVRSQCPGGEMLMGRWTSVTAWTPPI